MADSDSTDSPLEAIAGAAGPRATEAFSILADETRVSILVALWEAFEPFSSNGAMTFSELRDRVGVRDSGQFNYHLDQLAGHFVRKTDAGYELRNAGFEVVQTVITGAGIEEPSLDRTEIDHECFLCDAPVAVTYEDEWLYLVCTECDGYWPGREDLPSGVLGGGTFPPAGFTNRSPEEIWHAYTISSQNIGKSIVEGVCDNCSGPMESSVDVCEDHTTEGVCDNCGRNPAVMVHWTCPVCKNYHAAPPRVKVKHHPAVIQFFYERGVPFQYEISDVETLKRARYIFSQQEQELVSDDPLRIRVTLQYEGDSMALTLDEEMNVLEITEPD